MRRWLMLLAIYLLVPCCQCVAQVGTHSSGECKADTKARRRQLSVSMRRRVDESDGKWVNAFSARRTDPEGTSKDLALDAMHLTTDCDGMTTVHVEALVKELESGNGELSSRREEKHLIFHPRHGKNAVILDEGRSVQKLDLDDVHNAVVFTNKPLKTNELFEVRLEKRTTKSNHCLGVGVMIHSPENVEILKAMYTHSNGTWMYHNNGIYQNSKSLLSKYGHNIDTLQVRERVGVMRQNNGELHFFVNGVDQGSAASGIPEKIYGIVELWYDAVKVKIIY